MPRNGRGDPIEPSGVGLHYVVPAGAVNVHIHKPRHNGHSRRNVINRARRNANLVPMSYCRNPAALRRRLPRR